MAQQTVPLATSSTPTARQLACGVVAGPLFIAVVLVQGVTRTGFDLSYHPLSLLSLGALGWIQISNFVVTGGLYIACAGGLRRALRHRRAGTWGPMLIGLNGIGLILAGVCLTDAGAGFPPGAPAGAPAHVSWHAILHEMGFLVASVAWLAACFVFLRRFVTERRRRWVWACVTTPIVVVVVDAWPDLHSLSLRLLIGSAVSFGFVAALAIQLIRAESGAADR